MYVQTSGSHFDGQLLPARIDDSSTNGVGVRFPSHHRRHQICKTQNTTAESAPTRKGTGFLL
jgi:hypothetical protein